MSKKIQLRYSKERMLLSDVLPYEVPVTFSNRFLYDFLQKHELEYFKNNFIWRPTSNLIDNVIKLLLGFDINTVTKRINHPEKEAGIYTTFENEMSPGKMATIPFVFSIGHKEKQFRELTIIHPRNQIRAIEFYDKYKELILYFSSRSQFSLRAPNSIAKCVYWNDKSRLQTFEDDDGAIEESSKEYKNLRSFFVYKSHSNIFKFYESKEYHRCEKQYNKMVMLDISKCFDSIYTHSIAWALLSKESVKDLMSKKNGGSTLDKTFAGQFDRLMQQVNYHETNGIIIGPELSRVFSELILQTVDLNVFETLATSEIHFKRDYEIFRYVDDYFVFYNDQSVYKEIISTLQIGLKEYKLHLNILKETLYEKPIITEISIAKNQIAALLTNKIKYDITESLEDINGETHLVKSGVIYIKSGSLITDFKTILKISNVKYKDILNYSLSVLERKCKKLIHDFLSLREDVLDEKIASFDRSFINAIISIIEFTFFIYSVSPRVNTTVKLSRILDQFIRFLKIETVGKDYMHLVYKLIFDNVCFILNKNKTHEYTQVETLYLLVTISELGKEYWLEDALLSSYFGAYKENDTYSFNYKLNHFSITVLLFYMKNKKRYNGLRQAIIKLSREKFTEKQTILYKDAELTLLFFDLVACPFIEFKDKEEIMKIYGLTSMQEQKQLAVLTKYWFTKWSDFNFAKELDAKRSLDVY